MSQPVEAFKYETTKEQKSEIMGWKITTDAKGIELPDTKIYDLLSRSLQNFAYSEKLPRIRAIPPPPNWAVDHPKIEFSYQGTSHNKRKP